MNHFRVRIRWIVLYAASVAICTFSAKAYSQSAYCLQIDTNSERSSINVQRNKITSITFHNNPVIEAVLNYQGSGNFALSPDYSRIAYFAGNEKSSVAVLKLDPPPKLSHDFTLLSYWAHKDLQWSNDGHWIAYQPTSLSEIQHEVVLTNADGVIQAKVRVTLKPEEYLRFAGFSPDNQYLAITILRNFHPNQLRFFHIPDMVPIKVADTVLDRDGFRLVCPPSESVMPDPECQIWGQAGHRAVVQVYSQEHKKGQLYMFTVGGNDLRIFQEWGRPGIISPDGAHVAIRSFDGSTDQVDSLKNARIDIYSADGTSVHDVGQIGARGIVPWRVMDVYDNMVWTSDSQSLIYWVPGNPDKGLLSELRVFNIETGIDEKLSPLGYSPIFFVPSPKGMFMAFWGVDIPARTGVAGIISLATKTVATWAFQPIFTVDSFIWSPDGAMLAYAGIDEARIDATDVRVVSQAGNELFHFQANGYEFSRLWWAQCSD